MEININKKYTLYAGVNGAGKSTMYSIIKLDGHEERVNSDEILVSNGGNWKNEKDQIQAGIEAVKRINRYIKEGVSFNQETTLAGRSILGTIQKARENGFFVIIYYIGLNSPDLAIERVNSRVKGGGHGISEDVIRKRYDASLFMLKGVLSLCDFAMIYDNSKDFDKIAKYQGKAWTLFDRNCEWFNKAMPEVLEATRERYAKE